MEIANELRKAGAKADKKPKEPIFDEEEDEDDLETPDIDELDEAPEEIDIDEEVN